MPAVQLARVMKGKRDHPGTGAATSGDEGGKTVGKKPAGDREARLARALRDNLRKRKARQRARAPRRSEADSPCSSGEDDS